MTQPSPPSAVPSESTQVAAVNDVARKDGVDLAVVHTFEKISSPEHKAVFSASAAVKAFAHIKKAGPIVD
jgi:hypothetical protein